MTEWSSLSTNPETKKHGGGNGKKSYLLFLNWLLGKIGLGKITSTTRDVQMRMVLFRFPLGLMQNIPQQNMEPHY